MMRERRDEIERQTEHDHLRKKEKEEGDESNSSRKRLTACCTSKVTSGPRVFWVALLVLHFGSLFSEGLDIDPKPLISENQTQNYTFCLGSGKPIRFLDPFDQEILQQYGSQFAALNWFVSRDGQTDVPLLEYKHRTGVTVHDPRVRRYQFWGFEFTDVSKKDSGVYKVVLSTHLPGGDRTFEVWIVVAAPPKLASEKLVLKRHVDNVTRSVNVTCGKVASLGDPPIILQLKTSDGQVLKSSYNRGILSITVPKQQDRVDFVCEIDWDNSLAASCLSEEERIAWHGLDVAAGKGSPREGISVVIVFVIIGTVAILFGYVMEGRDSSLESRSVKY